MSYPQLSKFLHLICIDNSKVRKSILESKYVNINIVPCILVIYNNNTVQTFEGIYKCQEVINDMSGNPQPPQQPQFQQSPPQIQRYGNGKNDNIQKTPISSVINSESSQPPLEVEQEENETEEQQLPPVREKVNRNRGISTDVFRPERGQGHEGMISSIRDRIEKPKDFVELENLDEALNEPQPSIIKNTKKAIEDRNKKISDMNKEREEMLKEADK